MRYCILPPSYATTLLEPSTLPPSSAAILLMLPLLTLPSLLRCHPSAAATILTLPPFLPATLLTCHLLTLPSLLMLPPSDAVTLLVPSTLPLTSAAPFLRYHSSDAAPFLRCHPSDALYLAPFLRYHSSDALQLYSLRSFHFLCAQFTSLMLPAYQDHPINRITDKPGMWTKTDHRQTLWGG